ncbi:hypothetical protein WG936_08070 [Corynebacterium sp. H127]|uniref:hypothetical protein n=1 Tax=Corynebacterium sp. H127 TaxID=3133418 RepID=UPI0030A6976E
MADKTFTLEINGYCYEFELWVLPYLRGGLVWVQKEGAPLKITSPWNPDLWIQPSHEVGITFLDPGDPEIPQALPRKFLDFDIELADSLGRYGYGFMHFYDDRDVLFIEPALLD